MSGSVCKAVSEARFRNHISWTGLGLSGLVLADVEYRAGVLFAVEVLYS